MNWGKDHSSGSNRVKRGGNWNNNANNCRVANRNNNNPNNSNNNIGFRLCNTLIAGTGPFTDGPGARGLSMSLSRSRKGQREKSDPGPVGHGSKDRDRRNPAPGWRPSGEPLLNLCCDPPAGQVKHGGGSDKESLGRTRWPR